MSAGEYDDEFDFVHEERSTRTQQRKDVDGPILGLRPMDLTQFADLDVPQACKNLLPFIDDYQPRLRRISMALKAFVPDYVPAFGGVDDFIKVLRPDGKEDTLGIEVLDEPCAEQSNTAVLELQMRSYFDIGEQGSVSSIDTHDQQRNAKIDQWIHSVVELHEQENRIGIVYQNPMPSIEALMEQWPEEIADKLTSMDLAFGNNLAHHEMEFEELITVVCNLLQIPVYQSHCKDALHVLFSLLIDFQDNPYIFKSKSSD